MVYSVSTHDHDTEEIGSDESTLCSAMMVELWTRKREMGYEDENEVDDMSGYA